MDKFTRVSCGCKNNVQNSRTSEAESSSCKALKKRFLEVDFALTEVVLYLDAYPGCNEALAYYHRLREERELLLQSINTNCGPMTHCDNLSSDTWQWTNGPWPWKYEAN